MTLSKPMLWGCNNENFKDFSNGCTKCFIPSGQSGVALTKRNKPYTTPWLWSDSDLEVHI